MKVLSINLRGFGPDKQDFVFQQSSIYDVIFVREVQVSDPSFYSGFCSPLVNAECYFL